MPQPIPKRIRAVLSDQIIFSMRAVGDMQIHCIVLFDGMIDEDRMARAIRLGLDSEPVLGSRFSTSLWRPCWEYRHDLNNLELCKLIETTDVNQEMTKFLTSPIDPFGDPQVQACILRSKKDVFCIKVNHIAADAGGVKEFAYLLASIYRELFNNPGYIPEINLKGSRSLRQVSGKFTPLHKLGIIRRTFRNLKNNVYPNRYWTLPLVKGDHDDRTFVIRSINSERFQSIKSYCRTNTVTLNDVIIAAFYRAFTQLTDRNVKTPLRFMNTADLRRYLPAGRGEAICNLSGFVYLNIGQTVGETFNDTVSLVHHQMDFMKKDYIGLGDYPVILFLKAFPFALNRRLLDLMYKRFTSMKNAFPPCITNMGVIDKSQLIFGDPPVRDAFLTAPVMYPPILGIGLSGYGESVTVSAGFSETDANKPIIERLFNKMEDQLQLITSK